MSTNTPPSLNDLINPIQTVAEKIKQRRSQMLVHSYIYYWLDDNVVSDVVWQKWADELRELQQQFGWEIRYYDEVFKDWDGSTGCHLPNDHYAISMSTKLIRYRNANENTNH